MPLFDHFGFLAPFYEKLIQPKEPEFLKVLLNLPTEGALLDAGGGTGRVAQFMREKANQVIVADLSCKMLAEAAGKSGIEAICAPSETLPFRDGAFSRIIKEFQPIQLDCQIRTPIKAIKATKAIQSAIRRHLAGK